MKLRRSSRMLVEPPSSATGDIAFNLIVFFLVCASVQPDEGRRQTLPRADEVEQEQEQSQNPQVELTRDSVFLNGDPVRVENFSQRISKELKGRSTPESRVVVVKSRKDVPYRHWIDISSRIEDAGGIITLQLEEEQTVTVP